MYGDIRDYRGKATEAGVIRAMLGLGITSCGGKGELQARLCDLEGYLGEVISCITLMPDGVEKKVAELAYLDGLSQRDIAEIIGYSQSQVSRIIRTTPQIVQRLGAKNLHHMHT